MILIRCVNYPPAMPWFPSELLPDLDRLDGLDLSWNHPLFPTEEWPNLGVVPLYAHGSTGHQHVVALPRPDAGAEHWMIGLYNEVGEQVNTFATSIRTWLPAYLLQHSQDLIGAYRSWGVRRDDIDLLVEQEADTRIALDKFVGPRVPEALDAIYTALRTPDDPTWNPDAVRHMIEPDSCIDRRNQALAESMPLSERDRIIREAPHYNPPLFDLFVTRIQRGLLTLVELDQLADLPPELAKEVTWRYSNHDGHNLSRELIGRASELIATRSETIDPAVEFARGVVDNDAENLSELFFAAAHRWTEENETARAVACFHNAVHWHSVDAEEYHAEAVDSLRDLAANHAHSDYRRYMHEYQVEE